ncbi:MAG: 50S ribosomal protein L30 [Nitrospirota bacterium]
MGPQTPSATPATTPTGSRLAITLVRSPIGRPAKHKAIVKGLGFRKLQQTVIRPDNPAIRGMVAAISHMVLVEPHTEGRS